MLYATVLNTSGTCYEITLNKKRAVFKLAGDKLILKHFHHYFTLTFHTRIRFIRVRKLIIYVTNYKLSYYFESRTTKILRNFLNSNIFEFPTFRFECVSQRGERVATLASTGRFRPPAKESMPENIFMWIWLFTSSLSQHV